MTNPLSERDMVALDAYLSERKHDAYNILLDEGLTLTESIARVKKLEAATLPQRAPRVNDVLVCSWGYDQTNIDYYQVVAVTNASVKIKKINAQRVESHHGQDEVAPILGSFSTGYKSEQMTKRWKPSWDDTQSYSCKISDYSSATLWKGQTSFATAAGYGH